MRPRLIEDACPKGVEERLASGSFDNSVRLWDCDSGEQEVLLNGHTDAVRSVAFLPRVKEDGPLILASASDDGTIRLWDCDTAECLGILLARGDAWAALRPDGRYREVGDMREALWHCAGLVRYELGELDGVMPGLRLGEHEPLIPPARLGLVG